MSSEARAVVNWAIGRLGADATLVSLIADGKVYKILPRAAATADTPGQPGKPGVAVGFQSAQPPTGVLRTGPRTYSEQTVVLRVQLSQQTFSLAKIEAAEVQILALLDGQASQPLGAGVLYSCEYLNQLPDVVEPLGDQQIVTATLWFLVSAKAS